MIAEGNQVLAFHGITVYKLLQQTGVSEFDSHQNPRGVLVV